jgi:hypothetical protein
MSRFSSHAHATSEQEIREWSNALRELLGRFTAFPWALMTAVCQRHGCDPRALTRSEIEAMIPAIALAVASFNEVDDGFRVKRELLVMLRTTPSGRVVPG